MKYLHWNAKTITDFSDQNVSDMYNHGYVFTRLDRGVMHQTRSVRIDLTKFQLSSENRRILKKIESITLNSEKLPLLNYNFKIGKLAKDFYEAKFGAGIMSANKIKEMLTSNDKSNFNSILEYLNDENTSIGYSICYENSTLIHYSYPFYDLHLSPKDMGLGMMTLAIKYAQKIGKKYIYLGSLQRSTDTYKLQFKGLEWFDGTNWTDDVKKGSTLLTQTL